MEPAKIWTLKCPSCGTALRLKLEESRTESVRVRCSSCRKAFSLKRRPAAPGATPLPGGNSSRLDLETAGTGEYAKTVPPVRQDAARSSSNGVTTSPVVEMESDGRRTFDDGEMVAGRYRIIRFLAQGGMGEIYEAEDQALRQSIALKTVRPEIASDGRAVERFKREIHLARQVTHRNACRIYDLGTHKGTSEQAREYPNGEVLFLTMELVRGESLSERIRRRGRFSTEEALPLVEQMAAALDEAHAKGIIHRDFKSPNVLLEAKGGRPRAVVTDFGLARERGEESWTVTVTSDGFLGSPGYMAPEQVEGGEITPSTDIYSFGVVLYEMITGELPFRGENPLATAIKRLTENPAPPRELVPGLDPRWDEAILQCLERNSANRFATAGDLVRELKGLASRAEEQRSEAREAEAREVRKRSYWLAAAGFLVVVIVAGVLWLTRDTSSGPLVEGALPVVETARPSVAFLGFRNLTEQPSDDWMSAALSEMLGTELSSGGQVRIIPGENVARAKKDLGVGEGETLGDDSLHRLRSNLGADYVVVGSYALVGAEDESRVRLDLRLQSTQRPDEGNNFAQEAGRHEIFQMAEAIGRELRDALSVEATAGEGVPGARLAASSEAARLYVEGLERLRAFDPAGAREALEQAVEADPQNPRAHRALSEAWSGLGYSENARGEAKKAFELSSDLPNEERLEIKALHLEKAGDWGQAADLYSDLWTQYPDNLEYGLKLSSARTVTGRGAEALKVTDALRLLPSAAAEDPRIDLAEATACASLGDSRRQLRAAERAVEQSRELGARHLLAEAQLARGWALRNLGNAADARLANDEARKIYEESGDSSGVAASLVNQATLRFDGGDLDGADELFGQALATYREAGDLGKVAQVLNNTGLVRKAQGRLGEAEGLYEESLSISREIGNSLGMATGLNNLAGIRLQRGELQKALELYQEAHEVSQELDDRGMIASALGNIGVALRRLGRYDESYEALQQALKLRQLIGQRPGEVSTLTALADLHLDRGELAEAEELYSRALEMASAMGQGKLESGALTGQGWVSLFKGDLGAAREKHTQALTLRQDREDPLGTAKSRLALAVVALEEGAFQDSLELAAAAAEGFRRLGADAYEGWSLGVHATTLLRLRRLGEASAEARRAAQLVDGSDHVRARLSTELAAARAQAAADRLGDARLAAQAVEMAARRIGLTDVRYEALLLLAGVDLTLGQEEQATERFAIVEIEAGQKGYRLLAERAAVGTR